ncbi:MAG TPA: CPBP family glutamic-type intramembrane protease, partial [Candidatus Marinimicrobia bacterium]|nr:CPBP family glutamic-type intramembrane protease [Candidatus Neomarinimicrobiota bacterium]
GQFPILNRIFGAGLYEEIIVRWFFASFFIWIFWRLFDRNSQKPGNIVIWSGLIISNILFIIGHYPAVSVLISNNLEIINMFFWMFVITLPWGWLYWKFGIESAIIAHSVFHAIFILLQKI